MSGAPSRMTAKTVLPEPKIAPLRCYTRKETAGMLRVHPDVVTRLVRQGRLGHIQHPGTRRFWVTGAQLEEYLANLRLVGDARPAITKSAKGRP